MGEGGRGNLITFHNEILNFANIILHKIKMPSHYMLYKAMSDSGHLHLKLI